MFGPLSGVTHNLNVSALIYFLQKFRNTIRRWTRMPAHVMNIGDKFHWNPSTKYRDRWITDRRAADGRPDDHKTYASAAEAQLRKNVLSHLWCFCDDYMDRSRDNQLIRCGGNLSGDSNIARSASNCRQLTRSSSNCCQLSHLVCHSSRIAALTIQTLM